MSTRLLRVTRTRTCTECPHSSQRLSSFQASSAQAVRHPARRVKPDTAATRTERAKLRVLLEHSRARDPKRARLAPQVRSCVLVN